MGEPYEQQLAAGISRRRLLWGVGGSALATVLTSALTATELHAKSRSSSSKITNIATDTRGITLTLQLDHAPFPAGAKRYHDPTVLVFVPHHYRLPKQRRVDLLVHFHGHNTTALQAMQSHQLREQLFDSKQNGILIAPQGPVRSADSSAGNLDKRRGLARMLDELLRVLRSQRAGKALGHASLQGVNKIGHLCLSAHSGGYAAAASCLARGGVNVGEVYLFDALYGQIDVFQRWILKTKGIRGRGRHKLISHYAGGSVRANNLKLLAVLQRAGVRCMHEKKLGRMSRADMVRGSAIFIASPLSHGKVTVSHNSLRDCLFASGMKRHLRSGWFQDKNAPRKIDPRNG